MLIIKVIPGENIERVLKRFKRKVRKTHLIKRIRNNQEYTKKSKAKRDQLEKAIYRNEYLKNNEE